MQCVVRSSFEKPCIVAKNVAEFFLAKLLSNSTAAPSAQANQLHQFLNWLSALKSQVLEWLSKCAFSLQDPELIQAADLLKLITAFKASAVAAYEADLSAYGHAQLDSIRGLHDALIICCMFGWLPPTRVTMITTLLKPGLPPACLSEGCNCSGNQLHWMAPNMLAARWHHHKTARKQGGMPIEYKLPSDLSQLMSIILQPNSRRLLEAKGHPSRTVFVGISGKEITLSQWGGYFTRLINKLGTYRSSAHPASSFSHCVSCVCARILVSTLSA